MCSGDFDSMMVGMGCDFISSSVEVIYGFVYRVAFRRSCTSIQGSSLMQILNQLCMTAVTGPGLEFVIIDCDFVSIEPTGSSFFGLMESYRHFLS